jgi:cell division protein FtsB
MSGPTRASGGSTARRPAPRRPRPSGERVEPAPRWVRYTIFGVVGAVVLAVVAYFFPVRTYLEQRRRVAVAEQRLRLLDEQTREVRAERRAIEDPDEVIRIARDRFGMVKPGEQPWAVVPESSATTATTAPAR